MLLNTYMNYGVQQHISIYAIQCLDVLLTEKFTIFLGAGGQDGRAGVTGV